MFLNLKQDRIVERNKLWYVETETGYEGPFEHFALARQFVKLRKKAQAARFEFVDAEDMLY